MEREILTLEGALSMIGEAPFFVMIDDIQEIREEGIFNFLRILIDNSPCNVYFYFAVKGNLPHFLTSYILKGKMRLFGACSLRFTGEETQAVLNQMMGQNILADTADRIHQYMGGWPAGVMFACLALKTEGSFHHALPFALHSLIFDYIDYEIFTKYPSNIQKFLVDVVCLPVFCEELCLQIMEMSDSEGILNDLTKENICVVQWKGSIKWYHFHPVFRDFLQSRQNEERRQQILEKAAVYMKDTGETDQTAADSIGCKGHHLVQRDADRLDEKFSYSPNSAKKDTAVLKVFCLGSFCVMAGEKMLMWRTQKTKELFACLFFQEGRGLNKKELIFRLWPEVSDKKGSTLFHTTVSYLRKALSQSGVSNVFVMKDHLYFLNMKKIWSDFGRLEQIARQMKGNTTQIVVNPQELTELYGGEYLGSEDYWWLIGKKEYAEQMFLQTARKAAVREAQENHYDNAVLILQKILEIGGGSADTVRFLFTCKIKQGDMAAAVRQYKRMRPIWEEEWEQKLPAEFMDFINEEEV